MKKNILTSLVFVTIAFFAPALSAAVELPPVVVGYFSPVPKASFDEKIKPLFEKQTKNCTKCQIMNLTPYDEKGQFDKTALEETLEKVPAEVKILFFDFNLKKSEVSPAVIEMVNKFPSRGILIVAAAGGPADQQPSSPLSKTVFGQVKDAFIIGELGERDRLFPYQGYFGPEMLTALRLPKEFQGQGVGPLLFTSRLASDYTRRSPQEWTSFIQDKKVKSRKLWLDLQDLFR